MTHKDTTFDEIKRNSEFRIQISKIKEQRDSFSGSFDKLNHRIGMTSTIKQLNNQHLNNS
jgi:hypothetical protein